MVRTAVFVVCACAAAAWGQAPPRDVWLAAIAPAAGTRQYALFVSDYQDLVSLDVNILLADQAPLATVTLAPTGLGFMVAYNAVGDTLRIAMARANGHPGTGAVVVVKLPDSLPEPAIRLLEAELNGAEIPAAVEPEVRDNRPRTADFDGNGRVNLTDFFLFADRFGLNAGHPEYRAEYDLDGDGNIGLQDFFLLADQYTG